MLQQQQTQFDPTTGEAAQPAIGNVSDFDRLLRTDAFSTQDMLMDDNMAKMLRMAEVMAAGKVTVPKHLQGSVGDCMAIVTQAMQWNMNPFAVAQKTHIVNGTLGYEAQLVNAVVQASRAIVGSFQYEYRGEGTKLECRVGAILRGEQEITWNEWLCSNDVTVKNSPLWKTNPRQQMGYLQVKNWARLYCPGAILGVYTADEIDPEDDDPAADLPRGPQRKSAGTGGQFTEARASNDAATASAAASGGTAAASAPAASGNATGETISPNQASYLRNKMKSVGVSEESILSRFTVAKIELLSPEQFDTVKSELVAMA